MLTATLTVTPTSARGRSPFLSKGREDYTGLLRDSRGYCLICPHPAFCSLYGAIIEIFEILKRQTERE